MSAEYRCERCGHLSATRLCVGCSLNDQERAAQRNLIPVQNEYGDVIMVDLEHIRHMANSRDLVIA